MYLSELSRHGEAIAEGKEAKSEIPSPANACLAWTLWAGGENEKALHQALVATELYPSSMFATVTAGLAYEHNGMYRESIAEFEHGIQTNGSSIFLGFQGHAFARSGDKENVWKKLEDLSVMLTWRFRNPFEIYKHPHSR